MVDDEMSMENTLSGASDVPRKRRRKNPPKPRMLTRKDLDNRTNAAKSFDRLYSAISSDLGGDLTAVERSLVEGFVGATVVLQALNTRLALGQEIDLSEHAAVCSSMVRIAAKIGLSRRSRLVSGLIEAEAAPQSWSPLRQSLRDEAAEALRRKALGDVIEVQAGGIAAEGNGRTQDRPTPDFPLSNGGADV
jgi:hypothetical protein